MQPLSGPLNHLRVPIQLGAVVFAVGPNDFLLQLHIGRALEVQRAIRRSS